MNCYIYHCVESCVEPHCDFCDKPKHPVACLEQRSDKDISCTDVWICEACLRSVLALIKPARVLEISKPQLPTEAKPKP